VSGHPYHAHYGDQTSRWVAGEMLPMRFAAPSVESGAEHTLRLQPAES
jgi:penicillin G amidase